jgi:catechol 2,3-dioxygenase-like lactoylglutathione lyase family enzyme
MARLQLALNVSDLDSAIAFYSTLFDSEPAKLRPGYANFAVSDPPLKLVLIEAAGTRAPGLAGALNHLGVEVETPGQVDQASRRLSGAGMATTDQRDTTCCYAVQDKTWVEDSDGLPWEIYAVLADAPPETGIAGDGSCCDNGDDGSCGDNAAASAIAAAPANAAAPAKAAAPALVAEGNEASVVTGVTAGDSGFCC